MNAPILVVGVGNPWRGDDGVGWAVIDALEERTREVAAADPPLELVRADGESARLIDRWDRRVLAVVVDAVVSGAPPGTIRELAQAGLPGDRPGPAAAGRPGLGGTHGLGIDDAVALADALGRLPERLVVIGVEGRAFGDGQRLSPEVAAAVPRVVERIEALVSERPRCA